MPSILATASRLLLLCGSLGAGAGAVARRGSDDKIPFPGNGDSSGSPPSTDIPIPLFSSLERLSRLVDITYCVGTTGVLPPFTCASRCHDFPSLTLVTTWNTGVLMSDSCGYIAVDHGVQRPGGGGNNRNVVDGKPHGAIVVAFRGTYSITNTLIDLSTVPQEYVPYPAPGDGENGGRGGEGSGRPHEEPEHKCSNCTVHMGFLESWRQARELVLPKLLRLAKDHPDYTVHLVGHSLGGAVAALAALELKMTHGIENLVVTTFGEPRVGNSGLVRYLNEVFGLDELDSAKHGALANRVYRRVTHVDDPVPLLPLPEWGYRSHAGEIFISKPDLPPTPEDLRLCVGNYDEDCIAGSAGEQTPEGLLLDLGEEPAPDVRAGKRKDLPGFPTHLKLWQLLFAHRDYFWRLGLCVPGGDPSDWARERYNYSDARLYDEL